ncbi:hypothetical protein [Bradyrhizobium sp. SZCCHNR3118]|uniref:hypothetical protein n=1 Tax=Bradyrhizobium sp. SZCCHNR3118 TaxID=3057468 RepID=UPI0029164A10|nr:hypothetical protein [Bradyrhizobium sp. SZCCHNR3118]
MTYTYVFKNPATGELRRSTSHALVPAARAVGIDAVLKNGQWDLSPWLRWECWQRSECIWHYDDAGNIQTGSRT